MFWKRKNSQEEILAKLEEFLCAGREMMEDNRRKQEEEWMRQKRAGLPVFQWSGLSMNLPQRLSVMGSAIWRRKVI